MGRTGKKRRDSCRDHGIQRPFGFQLVPLLQHFRFELGRVAERVGAPLRPGRDDRLPDEPIEVVRERARAGAGEARAQPAGNGRIPRAIHVSGAPRAGRQPVRRHRRRRLALELARHPIAQPAEDLVARGAASQLRLAIHRAGPPLEQAVAAARPRRRPSGRLIDDAREQLGRRAEGSLEEERLGEADDQLVPLPGRKSGRLDRHERRAAGDEVVLRALPAESFQPSPSRDELRGVDELGLRDLFSRRDRAGVVAGVIELAGRDERIARSPERSRRHRQAAHQQCGAPPPHAPSLPHSGRWYHAGTL